MADSYREIARSSLDTTVAETGYANEQLTGARGAVIGHRKNHCVTQIGINIGTAVIQPSAEIPK